MTIPSTLISRPRPADLVPGYRLEGLLGKGGMGEVFRAVQLSLGRTVAVKLLSAELAKDEALVARFEKEGAALAALSHPNIVSIVDKGFANGTWYLVMELVDGPSLREVMRSPIEDPIASLRTVLEICRAIDYAHGRGVIHRDLKPENILFDDQAGHLAKVTDFGLAAFLDGDTRFNLTQDQSFMGTLSYMAPEQRVDARNADHRADIYALGIVVYEMMVGELPVGTFDPPSRKKPSLDRRLDAIIDRCLKPTPADRYQKVSELIAELEPLVPSSLTQRPRPLGRLQRAGLAIRRMVRTAIRAAAVLLVLAAAGVLAIATLRANGSGPTRFSTTDALTSDPVPRGALTSLGRISRTQDPQRVVLGKGPDSIPFITWGRPATFADGALFFGPPASGARRLRPPEPRETLGLAKLDVSEPNEGSLRISAEVSTGHLSNDLLTRLRSAVFATAPEPRATLVLAGTPGHFAAVTVSGAGAPITFEWALGDRRGTMLGVTSPAEGRAWLELEVNQEGELRAFLGTGQDRRGVGEPVRLGPDWKRYFGAMPVPEVACVEGDCEFRSLSLEIRRSPAAEAPPPLEAGSEASVPASSLRPAVQKPGGVRTASGQVKGPTVASAAKPTPVTARKPGASKPTPATAPARKPGQRRK